MKERQKYAKTFTTFLDFNSCNKHPFSSSSVGICPHCLTDRLVKLVCSDCGHRRVSSSCSCSISISSSSYRDSCSNVGRISFLIENEKMGQKQRGIFLRSRSSNCVEASRSSGFGRIKRLFAKRRDKAGRGGENLEFSDDYGDGFPRGIVDDENGFGRDVDDTGFIELKLDSWYECEQDSGGGRASDGGDGVECRSENVEVAGLRRNGNGGSCRITRNERGLKQGRSRNYKPWKWIFNFP